MRYFYAAGNNGYGSEALAFSSKSGRDEFVRGEHDCWDDVRSIRRDVAKQIGHAYICGSGEDTGKAQYKF